jgi:hypothetical protein
MRGSDGARLDPVDRRRAKVRRIILSFSQRWPRTCQKTATAVRASVGVLGGSKSDFPILEKAVAMLNELGIPNELLVVSAHRTPRSSLRLRGTGDRPGHPGHYCGRRRCRPSSRNVGGEDFLAGDRGSHPHRESQRIGLAVVHRADAQRHSGGDGRHRGRGECRHPGRANTRTPVGRHQTTGRTVSRQSNTVGARLTGRRPIVSSLADGTKLPGEPPVVNVTVIDPGATLGVLGGGQLGAMFATAARRLGYAVVVWDPDPEAPAHRLADSSLIRSFTDSAARQDFIRRVCAVTYEWENVPADLCEQLERDVPVRPSSRVLRVIQDRIEQKTFLRTHGLPVPAFHAISSPQELRRQTVLEHPLVCKTATAGYDGKGQWKIARAEDCAAVAGGSGSKPAPRFTLDSGSLVALRT